MTHGLALHGLKPPPLPPAPPVEVVPAVPPPCPPEPPRLLPPAAPPPAWPPAPPNPLVPLRPRWRRPLCRSCRPFPRCCRPRRRARRPAPAMLPLAPRVRRFRSRRAAAGATALRGAGHTRRAHRAARIAPRCPSSRRCPWCRRARRTRSMRSPRPVPATSAFRWVFARRTSHYADRDGKGKQADDGVTSHGASAWFWWAHSAQPSRSRLPFGSIYPESHLGGSAL